MDFHYYFDSIMLNFQIDVETFLKEFNIQYVKEETVERDKTYETVERERRETRKRSRDIFESNDSNESEIQEKWRYEIEQIYNNNILEFNKVLYRKYINFNDNFEKTSLNRNTIENIIDDFIVNQDLNSNDKKLVKIFLSYQFLVLRINHEKYYHNYIDYVYSSNKFGISNFNIRVTFFISKFFNSPPYPFAKNQNFLRNNNTHSNMALYIFRDYNKMLLNTNIKLYDHVISRFNKTDTHYMDGNFEFAFSEGSYFVHSTVLYRYEFFCGLMSGQFQENKFVIPIENREAIEIYIGFLYGKEFDYDSLSDECINDLYSLADYTLNNDIINVLKEVKNTLDIKDFLIKSSMLYDFEDFIKKLYISVLKRLNINCCSFIEKVRELIFNLKFATLRSLIHSTTEKFINYDISKIPENEIHSYEVTNALVYTYMMLPNDKPDSLRFIDKIFERTYKKYGIKFSFKTNMS